MQQQAWPDKRAVLEPPHVNSNNCRHTLLDRSTSAASRYRDRVCSVDSLKSVGQLSMLARTTETMWCESPAAYGSLRIVKPSAQWARRQQWRKHSCQQKL